MSTIIKYIRFPFSFPAGQLAAESNALTAQWVSHYNKAHYSGDWSALPLRSVNGDLSNVQAESKSGDSFKDTVLMQQCPCFSSILAHFPCEHRGARLLKLSPGAVVKEHTDNGLCFEQGEARIHVPVTTNPGMEFYLDGERIEMNPGECWYMNFDLPHRLANNGTTDRVHLVFDIMINDAVRKMFENTEAGFRKTVTARERFSAAERVQMIQRLRAMNTPVSLRMAEEMEAAL